MLLLRTRQDERSNPHRRRHVHTGEIEFLLVEQGRGVQLVGTDEERPCRAGDLFAFPSGCPHLSWCPPGQAFTALLLVIHDGDLAEGDPEAGGRTLVNDLARRALADPHLPLEAPTSRQVLRLWAQALEEQRSAAPGARCAVRALVQQSLVLLARDRRLAQGAPRHDDPDRGSAHIDAALRYLEDHALREVAIDDLLALGTLSRSRFLARFRQQAGRTVGDEVRRLRLAEARRLLTTTDLGVLEVALASGFVSVSHFSRAFRAAEGIPPGAWRISAAPCP